MGFEWLSGLKKGCLWDSVPQEMRLLCQPSWEHQQQMDEESNVVIRLFIVKSS